jgi:hypothetical protein
MKQEKREIRIGTIRGELGEEMARALENEIMMTYYRIDEFGGHKVLDVYVQVPVKK